MTMCECLGGWVPVDKPEMIDGVACNPDFTKTLRVGDLVKVHYQGTGTWTFHEPMEHDPWKSTYSELGTYTMTTPATGFVTAVFSRYHHHAMVMHKGTGAVWSYRSRFYVVQALVADGHRAVRVSINSEDCLDTGNGRRLVVSKWVPATPAPPTRDPSQSASV